MLTRTESTRLPKPSKAHATCAWCESSFPTIVELIDHVDTDHLVERDALLSA